MNNGNIHINRDGTNQQQRALKYLDTSSIRISNNDIASWLKLLYHLAASVSYFDLQNLPKSNWQSFFPSEAEINVLISDDINGNMSPQLALMLSFLNLLKIAQDDLNQLTTKHLNFYLQRILKLKPKDIILEQVHIVFELNKNITNEFRLPAFTLLNAGKDRKGNKIVYKTKRDIILNKAKIAHLKTVFIDVEEGERIYIF